MPTTHMKSLEAAVYVKDARTIEVLGNMLTYF